MAIFVKLNDDRKKNAAFKQDALDAWAAYQSSGLHLTFAEADAWLAKLEVTDNAKLPAFHT